MSIFFVSALVSVVLFAVILYVGSVKSSALRIVPSSADEKSGSIVPLIALGVIFLGLAFTLVAYLSARLYPSSIVDNPILTVILSQGFRSAVFGVLFAAFFLHWVSYFHSSNAAPDAIEKKEVSEVDVKPDAEATSGAEGATVAKPAPRVDDATEEKLKRLPQKLWVLEGYLLLALFIGGSVGAFDTLLNRLDTVKAGVEGVELSLRASANSTTKNLPQLATDNVSSGRLNEPNNAALSLLASLGEVDEPNSSVIMRDNNYLKMGNNEVLGVTKYQRPHLFEVISTFIAPLAKCQAGLWSATGSDRLSSRTFADLDEPMQELALQLSYNVVDPEKRNEMIENVSKAYAKVASETIKEAYVDNVLAFGTNDFQHPEKMVPIAAKNLRAKEQSKWWLTIRSNQIISQHCEPLRKAFCLDGEFISIYVPPNPNRTPEVVSVAFVGQNNIPSPLNLDAAPLNCQSSRPVEESERSFAKRFHDALVGTFEKPMVGDNFDNEWSGTPYAMLIAACVSSIVGENKAAIEEIDSWLSQRIKKNWYDVRMKTALGSIMEFWLTTDDVAASDNVLEEYHLTNLENVVSDIERELKKYQHTGPPRTDRTSGALVPERKRSIWNSTGTQPTIAVDLNHFPRDNECVESKLDAEEDAEIATLQYTVFTYMMTYLERAFRQLDFENSAYEGNAKSVLEELNTVEFGCLRLIVDSKEGNGNDVSSMIAYLRAQIYRFNALWKSHQYAASENALNKDEKRKMLQEALRIASEGLLVLKEPRKDEEDQRERATNFSDKVKASNVQQEYGKLIHLKNELMDSVNQIGAE